MSRLQAVADRLGYTFVDESHLQRALTHRSFCKDNNERLEFLGDSILNFAIAAELYRLFPQVPEGDLSRLRSSVVDKDTLVKVATALDLGDAIRLGGGELKSGGWRRDSILADAMEAVIGAVYEDAGIVQAQALVLRLYRSHLENLPSIEELKDAKTRLQEWLQGRKHPLPKYTMIRVAGKSHDQTFTVQCQIASQQVSVQAEGKSRRKAEQEAAQLALRKLEETTA